MGGEEHAEAGAPAGPIGDLDPAAVGEHDGPADSQPEPVAGHVRRCGGARAEEGLEDAFAIFDRDARALVLDRKRQLATGGDRRRDADGGGRRRELDGVLQQVGQHSLHRAGIHAQYRQVRWNLLPNLPSP
jgi:hypothetical protein